MFVQVAVMASYAQSGIEVMAQHFNVLNKEISKCDCSIVLGRNVDKHVNYKQEDLVV